MANAITPFDGGNLPAYLKNVNPAALNDDLTSHAGSGFPIISIKGKVFAISRDGDRKIIPNPKDEDSPATSIEMVLVKANKGTSKVYYAKGYTEGAENVKPDCLSNDGIRPDPQVEVPQCKTCAACPKAVWGSKIGDNGKKQKACQDSVRIAIATPDQINDPYLLRVPPASIRALGEYGTMLKKRGVSYTMVVTKIGFDMESPTPLLTFKAVGFLPEDAYKEVVEMGKSDVVQNILGSVSEVDASATETDDGVGAAVDKVIAQAKAVVPKITTKAKVVEEAEVVAAVAQAEKPKAKVNEVVIDDIDLSDLNFDD